MDPIPLIIGIAIGGLVTAVILIVLFNRFTTVVSKRDLQVMELLNQVGELLDEADL